MSNQFKACRCEATIPSEWAECLDCVVSGVREAGDRRASRLRRNLIVKSRMATGRDMGAILNQHKADNQETAILRARALTKAKVASRTAVALQEWMLG